ncbi:GNAT family N-acetyltransferase [Sphingomonas morindae]|uniref:N-acetyltransferase family protein n=1 Tax=Sphingomonas morindae TaxID=1541170 RepID=A0ABY4X8K9_9SPHN|nr:GNAT family N-acetyltransferase [Sphingomonas morindae]USI73276.1 N-acetyltransferase family protein [Sphingomonas morindae]
MPASEPARGPALIRPVRREDAAAIAELYRPYVTDSVITFELAAPDEGEIGARIEAITHAFPWLVAEREGAVIGYAYGSPYRTRAAYRWVAETGIYLAPAAQGQGLGRLLYGALLDALAAHGYVAAIGVLTLPNPASEALHAALGFRPAGVQPGIGFKQGRWHDVGFWQRDLAPRTADPAVPQPR